MSSLGASLSLLLASFQPALSAPSDNKNPSPTELAADAIIDRHGSRSIKIGYLASLTGPAAEMSTMMVNGARLYLDQIHNQMSGRHVEFIVENDGTSKDTAADDM